MPASQRVASASIGYSSTSARASCLRRSSNDRRVARGEYVSGFRPTMVYAVRTRSQTEGRSLCKSNYRVTTDSGMFCRVILLCLRVPLQACEALPREKTEEQESVTYPYGVDLRDRTGSTHTHTTSKGANIPEGCDQRFGNFAFGCSARLAHACMGRHMQFKSPSPAAISAAIEIILSSDSHDK